MAVVSLQMKSLYSFMSGLAAINPKFESKRIQQFQFTSR